MIHREIIRPRSWEVLDGVLERGDAAELARRLSYSPQLIRAYCRPPETEDEFSTGKFNDLDRLRTLISMIIEDDGAPDRAYPIGSYLASLLQGVFVPLPTVHCEPDAEIMKKVSSVLAETGEAIEASRVAWFETTPGKISNSERAQCVAEISEAITALVQLQRWIESRASIR